MPAPYRFNVIVTNAEIVFENAVTTEREYAINLYTVVDVTAHYKPVYNYGLAGGGNAWLPQTDSPWAVVANDATIFQDEWPDPNTISTLSNSQIPSGVYRDGKWFVRLHLNDQRFMDIPMGVLPNQATWTNDSAGADLCIKDIIDEIAMP